MSDLRSIPGVDKLLDDLADSKLPRSILTEVVRSCVARLREQGEVPPYADLLAGVNAEVARVGRTRLQSVINGTGVLIHTNLGRAPLGPAQAAALAEIAGHYNNLELDLNSGKRGGRAAYLERALALVTGGEAATAVNNCAAALVLILKTFAIGKEVIISRGELVQIGGGFRIPDILESSGAHLREVGTTNRTSLEDYAAAIGPDTGLILKVHQSNFDMTGFVAAPSTAELTRLAEAHDLPFIEDLGSGALVPLEQRAPIPHEPTPAERLKQGCHLICVSGDKLLGGPQAGIIAGRKDLVTAVKKNPFFRALRCDRLVFTVLQATMDAYLSGRQDEELPVLQLMQRPREELAARGQAIVDALGKFPGTVTLGEGISKIGGGAMPSAEIPSVTLEITHENRSAKKLSQHFREQTPAVMGFVESDCFKLDLRTVFPDQDTILIGHLQSLY